MGTLMVLNIDMGLVSAEKFVRDSIQWHARLAYGEAVSKPRWKAQAAKIRAEYMAAYGSLENAVIEDLPLQGLIRAAGKRFSESEGERK